MLIATDPSTGLVTRKVEALDAAARDARIEASFTAFEGWKARSFAERGEVLRSVARVLREDVEELAPLMTEELGKPIKEARAEVEKAAWCAEHYAESAEVYLAAQILESDATKSYVQHLPLGPVLGVLPWNAPFWLASRFFSPALMAGNTCLMKHDPHVPGCAEAIAAVFERAGAPEGVFQNLPLETPEVGDAIRHRRVRAVSFTGSERAGSKVAQVAAEVLKPSVLELGGSDPAIVLADADLDAAVPILALSRIINAGQSCIAAKRMLVEDAVYDAFVEKLHAHLAGLKMGDPRDESTDVGPIAREDLRDNLARQVDATKKEGARCLLGGEVPDGPGFYYPVTLLVDVTNDMTACREETFGPVAVVQRVADAEEALRIANDSEYGLAGSIWSTAERGEAMAARIDTGQVAVNGIVKTDPRLPSGGVKRSGWGRELGPHGILEFVNAQQVWVGPKKG